MFSILNVSSHRILGKSGSTSFRRADSRWRITNADHNRDRKRLNTAGRLCEKNTGRNFTPKLVKKVVSVGEQLPQIRSRDPQGPDVSRPTGWGAIHLAPTAS